MASLFKIDWQKKPNTTKYWTIFNLNMSVILSNMCWLSWLVAITTITKNKKMATDVANNMKTDQRWSPKAPTPLP